MEIIAIICLFIFVFSATSNKILPTGTNTGFSNILIIGTAILSRALTESAAIDSKFLPTYKTVLFSFSFHKFGITP
jgi:hypothetical protein